MLRKCPPRLLSLACLTLLGCESRPGALEEPIVLVGEPVALDRHLAFVDDGLDRALLIDVGGDAPGRSKRWVDLPERPVLAQRRAGEHDALLVLGAGRRATTEEDAEDATLSVVQPSGDMTTFTLSTSPFDRMVQSPEGSHALLFRETQGDHLLENTNVVALVTLDDAPGAGVHFHTLDFRPETVHFTPPMQIGGGMRRLVVATADSALAIIDVEHPERRVTSVRLSVDAERLVRPVQLLFDAAQARIYVRPETTRDVFALRLTPREVAAERNDFATAIDILSTDGFPTAMALYGEGASQRLLVLSQEVGVVAATVVDPGTSRTSRIMLPGAVDRIELFDTEDQGEPRTHALLWKHSGARAFVLDLHRIEELGSRNLEQLATLPALISRVLPLPGEDRLLLVHESPGLSLFDLQTRAVAPFAAATSFDEAIFDVERGQVWVAPPGQPRVGFVQVDGGATDELLLDENVLHVVPVLSQDRLAVIHPSDVGSLSLVDVTDPQRSALHTLEGFLLHDLLD